jgi:hypothetical protein
MSVWFSIPSNRPAAVFERPLDAIDWAVRDLAESVA